MYRSCRSHRSWGVAASPKAWTDFSPSSRPRTDFSLARICAALAGSGSTFLLFGRAFPMRHKGFLAGHSAFVTKAGDRTVSKCSAQWSRIRQTEQRHCCLPAIPLGINRKRTRPSLLAPKQYAPSRWSGEASAIASKYGPAHTCSHRRPEEISFAGNQHGISCIP